MRKYTPAPQLKRHDERTGDEFIREWVKHLGTIRAAERAAGMTRTHLHGWLSDPGRHLNPETTLKLSRAASLPTEAIEYRFTKMCDLDMWRWLEEAE